MALKGRAGHKHKIIMVNLTKAQMSSVSCGLTKEQCDNSAVVRWGATGVVMAIGFIPVVGWIIATPSALALWGLDGACAFIKE